jgi:hypothetical protein
MNIKSKLDKDNVRQCLRRLVNEGTIERAGGKDGVFRRVIADSEPIDFRNAPTEVFDIRWPFDIQTLAHIHPGNIIVIAGDSNAGKTALLMNVIDLNIGTGYEIFYFSSEMGASELKTRLLQFRRPLKDWDFKAFARTADFADVIRPDAINIIDYLEMSDNFFTLGGQIRDIFDKLDKGIAIIAIQKATGAAKGRGGDFGLEKPRLYMSISQNPPDGAILKLIKAKNRASPRNPNGLQINFKIVGGAKLIKQDEWHNPLSPKGQPQVKGVKKDD